LWFIVAFVELLGLIWVVSGVRTMMLAQQLLLPSWSRMVAMHSQQPLDAFYMYHGVNQAILVVYCCFCCACCCDLGKINIQKKRPQATFVGRKHPVTRVTMVAVLWNRSKADHWTKLVEVVGMLVS